MTRVIVFGDSLSHVGPDAGPAIVDVAPAADWAIKVTTTSVPGAVLAREIAKRGHTVRVNAMVGRSAWNFFVREPAKLLLERDAAWKPELVVVWLGTNDIGISSVKTREAMVKIRDAYKAMGARVVAIGPPAFADDQLREGAVPVYATMAAVFGDVVDARPRSLDLREQPYRARDGVHFTARGAELLGTRLCEDITAPISPWWAVAASLVVALVFATYAGGTNM